MIYVASPYSHAYVDTREFRYTATRDWVMRRILELDEPLFSPIVYMHQNAITFGLNHDAEAWWKFNEGFLAHAERMYVYCLDGWRESKGVTKEIAYANHPGRQIPTTYFLP